jgi:hypothetical protein
MPDTSTCLIGCIRDFTCSGVPLVTPVNGENISPWVKARFAKGDPGGVMEDEIITVGNESCWLTNQFGEPHHASIKAFEYGTTDGHKCKMDIVDEEGGAFTLFIDKILKCLDNAKPQYFFQVQWGWSIQNCDGEWDFEASPIVTFVPINLEVSFSNGVVKYNITGSDAFQIVFMAREDEADGDDAHPMCLNWAIKERMAKNEPKADVEFKRKMPDGTITDFQWKQSCACGPEGPISSWTCDNQNKMGTVSRWIQPFRTKDDKGVYMLWDNEKTEPTITLWEDGSLECKEKAECNPGRHLGSFIVNGGKCSNVISFTPNINWPAGFAMMAQGGALGGPMSSKGVKTDNRRPGGGGCETQGKSQAGIMQSVHLTRQSVNCYSADKVIEETEKSEKAHNKANIGREGITPIQADLTIQGNPGYKFVASKWVIQSYASIVVINPFHLSGPWWDGCGDWMVLADSGCNSVLSNRFWKVMGVTHQIKEGSYVTVLKVMLPVPGVEISPEQPLGTDDMAYVPMNSADGKPC